MKSRRENRFERAQQTAAVLLLLAAAGGLTISCSVPPVPAVPHTQPNAVTCVPANGRQGQLGCWIIASAPVSAPAGTPLYWHVYEFSSPQQAQAAGDPESRVIEAYGRTWLLTVAAENWNAKGGRRAAKVGPLHRLSAIPHTASFMEATFTPGMRSRIHTHPGPEAWHVLEGEQCLETSEGVIRVAAGESMMVRGGIPMALFGTGGGIRRALVLIIHPSNEPPGKSHSEWQPTGACLASGS